MEKLFKDFDIDSTIRDYEFTRRGVFEIASVVDSEDFENMDSNAIFLYLYKQMQVVSFKDYLKRYIYESAQIPVPFLEVSDEDYRSLIEYSFAENAAPHSFEPTSTRWVNTVKSWLKNDSARRSTVFLLGFGLHMSAENVSEFLTKVLKEEDFDFSDRFETICWYCFTNSLKYAYAAELLSTRSENTSASLNAPQKLIESTKEALSLKLNEKNNLLSYLRYLEQSKVHENRQKMAYENFICLIDQAKDLTARIYEEDPAMEDKENKQVAEEITSADIEKVLCSGIPLTPSGNLQKASLSVLNRQFQSFRMSRQRIDSILKKKQLVDRYDLITLEFFLFSQKEYDLPEDRCRDYIDEINRILSECRMMKMYPVNPYEAFVLMCLLTDYPLGTYSDVWELSYS